MVTAELDEVGVGATVFRIRDHHYFVLGSIVTHAHTGPGVIDLFNNVIQAVLGRIHIDGNAVYGEYPRGGRDSESRLRQGYRGINLPTVTSQHLGSTFKGGEFKDIEEGTGVIRGTYLYILPVVYTSQHEPVIGLIVLSHHSSARGVYLCKKVSDR